VGTKRRTAHGRPEFEDGEEKRRKEGNAFMNLKDHLAKKKKNNEEGRKRKKFKPWSSSESITVWTAWLGTRELRTPSLRNSKSDRP